MRIAANDAMLAQVDGLDQADESNRPRPLREHNAFAAMGEDTVRISDEARALLESKMEEYGADTPDDLSDEQLADLKKTMAEAEGVTDEDRQALAERAGDRPPPMGGGAEAGGRGERRGPPPKKPGGSSGDDDEVDDLKSEISDLEDEIEALRAKAATDEESKEELKSKQTELSLLESELALLEQAASAQAG